MANEGHVTGVVLHPVAQALPNERIVSNCEHATEAINRRTAWMRTWIDPAVPRP